MTNIEKLQKEAQKLLNDPSIYQGETEQSIQRKLQKRLRELAIAYIQNAKEAESIRENISQVETLEHYIQRQKKDGAWVEAPIIAALSRLLHIKVTVKDYNNQSRINGYEVGTMTFQPEISEVEAEKLPEFVIYNSSNTHYYVDPKNPSATRGDGNCGLNAFAQLLYRQAKTIPLASVSSVTASSVSSLPIPAATQSKEMHTVQNPLETTEWSEKDESTHDIELLDHAIELQKAIYLQFEQQDNVPESPKISTSHYAFFHCSSKHNGKIAEQIKNDEDLAKKLALEELMAYQGTDFKR